MTRHPLSDEQLVAIGSRHPRTFIEAGPGSGKTTVAAERFGLLRHVRTGQLDPPVVAVSFTHAATSELRERIVGRWGGSSLGSRGTVRTIDTDFVAHLEFLLRSGAVTWPGGHTRLDPLDSWEGSRARRFRPDVQLNWDFFDIGLDGRAVGAVKRRDKTARSTFPSKKVVLETLEAGECAHTDVRQILASAMADAELRSILRRHLQLTRSHLLVDEIFDANDEDLELVTLHCEADIPVTVVGDYWQALYEFRTASPSLVRRRLDDLDFRSLPLLESRRFDSEQTRLLALTARGSPAELPSAETEVDVVLAHWWSQLWRGPAWILPISLGRVSEQTTALLTLFVDYLTRRHLGVGARSRVDALRILGISSDAETLWPEVFEAVASQLTDTSIETATTALETIRSSAPRLGAPRRVTPLGTKKESIAVEQLRGIAARVLHQGRFTLGLSVHQAKGQEWKRVGVRLSATQKDALLAGLDSENDHHRTIYVALTRGREITCEIAD